MARCRRRQSTTFWCPAAWMLALVLGSGCGGPGGGDGTGGLDDKTAAAGPPPNILLISVDTLRRDHLGCYDYNRDTTPNLDTLAAQGTVFDNAWSTCSWTLPSHTSMLTGLYPAFHGLQDDGVKLPPETPTVAEALRDRGYHTLAVVSHTYVSSEFGLERGFDVFDDSLIIGGTLNPNAALVARRALERIAAAPEGPYFAFVHFFDPHWDYEAPEPYGSRFTDPDYSGPIDGTLASLTPFFHADRPMPAVDLAHAVALYDGEVAFVDAKIGELIGTLGRQGRLANTVVAVTGDHGEEFKEHGRLGHAKTLFGEQLGVPLIIAGHAAFPPGSRRDDLVSLVDLGPTLLELAGAEPLPGAQGESFLRGGAPADRVIFAESIRFGNEIRTAQWGGFKVIRHLHGGGAPLFYNLVKDPGEGRPLAADPTDGVLSDALDAYAAAADAGWHMKLISLGPTPLRCRAALATEGRFVEARPYFSSHISEPSGAALETFDVSPDGRELRFDVTLRVLIGEVAFATEPPDAPVTFRLDLESGAPETGVFLGSGAPAPGGQTFTLVRTDPRLDGVPRDYASAPTGCYIRAVIGPTESAPRTDLSDEAVAHLKALGYIEE